MVLDSAEAGPTVIIHAPEEGAGRDVLRQLQYDPPVRGRLVLAREHLGREPASSSGWETGPGLSLLTSRFQDARLLVFRKDEDAHAYDPQFRGDTVQGSGEGAAAVLKSLCAMKTGVAGKGWEALPATGREGEIVVTTNARFQSNAGLRPALQERELRTAAQTLLRHLGMTGEKPGNLSLFPATRSGQIRVAVFDDMGAQSSSGHEPSWLRSRLEHDAGLQVELVGVPEILQGALSRADVLVMGGGKSSMESKALGEKGRTIVVDFVRKGGGYLGICAGAFLGSSTTGKIPYLKLLPVTTGATALQCQTPLKWRAGALGEDRVEKAEIHGGPSFQVMEDAAGQVDVWATFAQNEVHPEKGEYKLKDTPAVISGSCGKGKVILTSTHCERPPSPSTHFAGMVRWVAEGSGEPGK
ncbi:BPL-N domain-containing protein [Luteolibacter soli]|uniref:BPL-N domain-containing protein n=1 Tax=Luteolibacter soli TaxID=3135280 RepID=A0ABU9ASA7_9BACT